MKWSFSYIFFVKFEIFPLHYNCKRDRHSSEGKVYSRAFFLEGLSYSLLQCKRKSSLVYGPRHEISNTVVRATSKGSDQTAHTRSLIRAFAIILNIL